MNWGNFLLTWGIASILVFILLTLIKQWIKRIFFNYSKLSFIFLIFSKLSGKYSYAIFHIIP